ncbi:MAG TPA: tetratricopeptide repeat protein [Planctomycetota bacterium]|nr:tetratricopeptide repeat protein [Planctomycetota bacterium]OQC22250.1 MAG: Tetratricopeptide repeat protein [Planctomycetes bacterium ADurb.Bin069]HNU25915.1 tetratricopeptide repeat protein [Planctomycetota bacterium]HOE29299.1 tetratricopeptide repeat protein [Planctomycetota bacterium]HOE86575.1 tetratricopeptide repeat protein [Planctomycetota bacterium]
MRTPGYLAILSIPAAALLVYAGMFAVKDGARPEFVFDDAKLIKENPWAGSFADNAAAFNIFSDRWERESVRINYRPLRFLSYAIDWNLTRWLWPNEEELRTTVFHAHNVLLHGLNGVLLLLVFARLLPGTGGLPLFLALTWVVHPLATESVAYVSGRRDVLFAACYLGALALYLGGAREWWRIGAAAVLYVLGLLTKEMAATLPAAMALSDMFLRRRLDRRAAACYALLGAAGAAYIAFKLGVKNPGGGAPYWGGTPCAALLTEARAIFRYVYLALAPVKLSADWSYAAIRPSAGLLDPWTTLPAAIAAAAGAAAAAWAFFRRRSCWAFGVCLFFVTLAPVMQIVPHPERFAERYMYLPLAGLLLAGAMACNALRPLVTGKVAAAVLLVAFAARAHVRTDDWRSSMSLWESAVAVNPECARARIGLGFALSGARRWREAATQLDRAIEILATLPSPSPLERGNALQARAFRAQADAAYGDALKAELAELAPGDPRRGDLRDSARRRYARAAADWEYLLESIDADGRPFAEGPGAAGAYRSLGALCFRLEEYDRADAAYRQVLALTESSGPAAREARFWLGMIALAGGKTTLGTRQILRAAQDAGDGREAFAYKAQLAEILRKVGRWSAALDIYDEIRPHAEGQERLAIEYARAEIFDRLGKRADAIILLRQLLREQPDLLPAEISLMDLELKEGRWRDVKPRLAALEARHGALPVLVAYAKQIALQEALEVQAPGRRRTAPDADTLMTVGRENLEAGAWEFAIDAFKDAYIAAEAAGRKEVALRALRYLARSLERAGRPVEALPVLRNALAAAPDDPRFLKDLGDLYAGSLDNLQEALVAYQRLAAAAADGATRIEANLAMGALLERNGAGEEAAAHYDRAAEAGSVPNEINRRRGELWEAAGDAGKARAAYDAYLANAEDSAERRAVEERRRALPDGETP